MQQQEQQHATAKPVSYAFKYLNSPYAKMQYPRRLKLFFDHLNLLGDGGGGDLEEQGQAFLDKARENPRWAQESILDFIDFHKKRVVEKKELAAGTLMNFFQPIKLFCEMNDLTMLNWKRLSKALPRVKSYSSNDRAPTIEEIRKLVEYPTDRRIKPLVYVMCSSGIRLGAWDYLRWKHVIPKTDDKTGELVAAKLIVYAGEPEEYYTFITPEAYNALKDYMDFRALWGEKITGESLLIRDEWKTSDIKIGGSHGLASCPKKIGSEAIKRIITRGLCAQGLRRRLPEGVRRHEWKGVHGFRKFFKTHAEQVMKPLNVELLMGHNSGISESYYRPTEKEVLADYLKAVELLTINDDKTTLKKQVAERTQKELEELKKRQEEQAKLLKKVLLTIETYDMKAVDALVKAHGIDEYMIIRSGVGGGGPIIYNKEKIEEKDARNIAEAALQNIRKDEELRAGLQNLLRRLEQEKPQKEEQQL